MSAPLRDAALLVRRLPGEPDLPENRIADVRETLRAERHLWLATAEDGMPQLVPLAYVWDGAELLCATEKDNRSVHNLAVSGKARVAVGTTGDAATRVPDASIVDMRTCCDGHHADPE